ncbi:MAG: hypothetical protein C5S47_07570 [Candidatus Methanogasteraceae archaeon]|nr:MAG: hypothetical protein C5S47_07570 [ANME-2 cluster archaeon]
MSKLIATKKRIAVLAAAIILVSSLTAYALLATSHTTYKTKDDFCTKCHANVAINVSAGIHNPANCICHGYLTNSTYDNGTYDINRKHNLTKDIYCTNCHSDSNEIGDIPTHIGPYTSGRNQTAHYLIKGNKTAIYDHAKDYLSKGGHG